MRKALYMVVLLILCSCGDGKEEVKADFEIEVINGMTPVKDQKRSNNCWAYAMLAAIETEHIMRGDSVNLSVAYVMRSLMYDSFRRYCLSGGKTRVTDRAMGQTLINLIGEYGAMPYDSYREVTSPPGSRVILNKTCMIARKAINTRAGLSRFRPMLDSMLDESIGYCPPHVFMLGMQYTPQEFARSVCAPGEYIALTSFTHHPFYTSFALEVPDNWEQNRFYNIPLDSLMRTVDTAVKGGRGVCWEGDISERGFSAAKGIADIKGGAAAISQEARQKSFEQLRTTDDHCMAIVGIARNKQGRKFYIMKNSWGTDNPYGGLIYMSEEYMRMKTIAVYVPRS